MLSLLEEKCLVFQWQRMGNLLHLSPDFYVGSKRKKQITENLKKIRWTFRAKTQEELISCTQQCETPISKPRAVLTDMD